MVSVDAAIRQVGPGEWEPVIGRVREALAETLARPYGASAVTANGQGHRPKDVA